MKIYIFRRILQMIPTLLAISLLVFSLLYITPGDPVLIMMGSTDKGGVSNEAYTAMRHQMGLDKSFLVRYFDFLRNALRGDLGTSFVNSQSVFCEIMARFPATLILTFACILIGITIALPLGIVSAVKHNGILDSIASFCATVGVSLPKFWLAQMLIILFSLKLGWLPSQGIGYIEDGLGNYLIHLILPAFSLSLGLAASMTRLIRSSMLEVLDQDYVKFAKSKGLNNRTVIVTHALRNSLIPVITLLGTEFGGLLSGAIVTEAIFAWPGVGRLIVNSIGRRDYPMVQGATLLICVLYLLINLLVDISYAWLDPKVRLDR